MKLLQLEITAFNKSLFSGPRKIDSLTEQLVTLLHELMYTVPKYFFWNRQQEMEIVNLWKEDWKNWAKETKR